MTETLPVKVRKAHGKHEIKKLRREGQIPAILYGHGQPNVNLAIPTDAIATALRHGSRFVSLAGEVSDTAIIRELQWDTFGLEVLHIDLFRVSMDEKITVKVPVDIRGKAPGTNAGGVVQLLIHEAEIECAATSIPEKIYINVNHLNVGDQILVGQIALPEGIKLLEPEADELAVQCIIPTEKEEVASVGEGIEPELIRKPKEDKDEEE